MSEKFNFSVFTQEQRRYNLHQLRNFMGLKQYFVTEPIY
jgi:hypothetical protein